MLKIETGKSNKILRGKSKPIKKIDNSVKKLIKEMAKAMIQKNGVGLAAPQVAEPIRIIIARLNAGTEDEVIVSMINPEIVYFSDEKEKHEEGCLSLPELWGDVVRSKEIIVRFLTEKSAPLTLKLKDFNARVIQHEIDHLEGVLFTDKARNLHKKKEKDTQAV